MLATVVLAQGMGPGRGGSGMMGGGRNIAGPGMMQGSVITPTVPLAPAQGGCGYGLQGQGGCGGFGPGMMGMMQGNGGCRSGPGHDGRPRGMMGGDMMGVVGGDDGEPGVGPWSCPKRLTAAEVTTAVDAYLAQNYKDPDLEDIGLIEFEKNFYAQVAEKSTEINAFELLIDPYTGAVWPEYGPNMMWNTKYGHMSGMGGMMMQGLGRQGHRRDHRRHAGQARPGQEERPGLSRSARVGPHHRRYGRFLRVLHRAYGGRGRQHRRHAERQRLHQPGSGITPGTESSSAWRRCERPVRFRDSPIRQLADIRKPDRSSCDLEYTQIKRRDNPLAPFRLPEAHDYLIPVSCPLIPVSH